MTPPADLDPATAAHSVLKAERSATVEVCGEDGDAIVRKTYRNRGLRLLQTFGRRSRAEREFQNLRAVEQSGVECTSPLGWSERRRAGFVRESILVTRFLPTSRTLKHVLASQPPATSPGRRRLVTALGRLLAALHRSGFVWCTPMPRNVLVVGPPDAARLAVCDVPAGLRCGRPCHGGALALLDLFDAAFSPSRRRELSSPERWRCLLAYHDGDRPAARHRWRRLVRRTVLGHRLRRNFAMVLHTYILAPLRRRRPTRPNEA